jgi:F0F1-type ATP synthase membrane subunit a
LGFLAKHGLNEFEQIALVGVMITAFISLLYAWLLRGTVLKKDKGTAKMQEVWNAIRIGADSYLGRQLKSILPLIAVLTVAMFLTVYIVPRHWKREWHCISSKVWVQMIHTKTCATNLTIEYPLYQQPNDHRRYSYVGLRFASFSLIVGQWACG